MTMQVNVGKILQNLLVVGVQIAAAESTAPPEPKPVVKLTEVGPPPPRPARPPLSVPSVKLPPLPPLPALNIEMQPVIAETGSRTEPVTIASTPDTRKRLRERLAEELYRMQMDLEDGAHIGGVPCDCLDSKHKLGLRATAKELLAMDDNPVPSEVLTWLAVHEPELNPQAIKKYGPDHYRKLAGDMREFRKRLGL